MLQGQAPQHQQTTENKEGDQCVLSAVHRKIEEPWWEVHQFVFMCVRVSERYLRNKNRK